MSSNTTARQPIDKPDFTIKTLRDSIPKHCFVRSTWRSMSYLIIDLLVVACLAYAAVWFDHPAVPRNVAKFLLWPLYWFWQGAFCTGIWVVAHECGHGAFSDSKLVNDTVGLVFHSLLLVPYYSWKHSHRRHHSNTGSADKDEVFVPKWLDSDTPITGWYNSLPIRMVELAVTLTMGWPLYLFFNVSGRKYERWANHFDPFSPIFSKRERVEVLISDLGLLSVGYLLYAVGSAMGWTWLLKMYGIPYLIVNFWLVMITLLQHTHPALAHYDTAEWDWLRGALSTVDRSYGILDPIFHHIADTHVAHHLFSQLPHYHAVEATRHLKAALGKYYQQDTRNVFMALWQDWWACKFMSPDKPGEKVYWFVG